MSEPERFGPLLTDSGATFRLWAPAASTVDLMTVDKTPMQRERAGWFTATVPGAKAGMRYQFKIDGELDIPDPASRFQPDDVHGPSEIVARRYDWKAANWKGRPWSEANFLELHVGTFTPEGTFLAAIAKLDHVVDTGISAIELMPLSDFPGRWNWGYDGVLPFAPDSSYGRPNDLKALIDAAHQRGLMVFLDVVYNHFGPEGNYLGRIAPQFFSEAPTPWGNAINYEIPEVRAFAIENAVSWVRDYRLDGLRLDAVHAIVQPGEPHILHDISAAVGEFASQSGRHIHLVLENDDNRAGLLSPQEDPPAGRYRAQWNDDYHHAWHVFLTGETAGYYKDYTDCTSQIARALAEGFAYQGEASQHRDGQLRGESTANLSPSAFVNFLQNHDQIGNRALGDRLTTLATPQAIAAAATVLRLAPSPPLLFMGEEWGSKRPFPFFCDFTGELAEAVRKGRRKEFAEAYADAAIEVPDPLAKSTMESAKLDWEMAMAGSGADRLALVRDLLRARRQYIVPLLPDIRPGPADVSFENGLLAARWRAGERTLRLVGNLSDRVAANPAGSFDTDIWGQTDAKTLEPWSVLAGIGGAR
jgi:malto-oligosyltrehalose trehalohydrolase